MMPEQFLLLGLLIVVLGLLARVLYWRVPANVSYIREGLGKRRVMLTGGGLVIPGVHKISSMRLGHFSLDIDATRQRSLFTGDPLRIDVEANLLIRIKPEVSSVLAAEAAFAGEVDNIRSVIGDRCRLSMQAVASEFSLENLSRNSADFELRVNEILGDDLEEIGLEVVLLSIKSLQPTRQLDYRRENSLDAEALAVLDKVSSEKLGKLHTKLRETDLQIKKLDFDAAIKALEWEEQLTVAKLEHRRHKAEIEARLASEIKEIEVSRQLAVEMIERDVESVRLQYQVV